MACGGRAGGGGTVAHHAADSRLKTTPLLAVTLEGRVSVKHGADLDFTMPRVSTKLLMHRRLPQQSLCPVRGPRPFVLSTQPAGTDTMATMSFCTNRWFSSLHTLSYVLPAFLSCAAGRGADLRQDGLMVDVGANYGYYGLLAAAYGCRSIMYEPQARLVPHIEASTVLNSLSHLAVVRNKGVSNVSETRTISRSGGDPLNSGAASFKATNRDGSTGDALNTVQLVTLDEDLDSEVAAIDFLKVDVEGMGEVVVGGGGARRLLQSGRVKAMCVEVGANLYGFEELLAFFRTVENYGYTLFGFPSAAAIYTMNATEMAFNTSDYIEAHNRRLGYRFTNLRSGAADVFFARNDLASDMKAALDGARAHEVFRTLLAPLWAQRFERLHGTLAVLMHVTFEVINPLECIVRAISVTGKAQAAAGGRLHANVTFQHWPMDTPYQTATREARQLCGTNMSFDGQTQQQQCAQRGNAVQCSENFGPDAVRSEIEALVAAQIVQVMISVHGDSSTTICQELKVHPHRGVRPLQHMTAKLLVCPGDDALLLASNFCLQHHCAPDVFFEVHGVALALLSTALP